VRAFPRSIAADSAHVLFQIADAVSRPFGETHERTNYLDRPCATRLLPPAPPEPPRARHKHRSRKHARLSQLAAGPRRSLSSLSLLPVEVVVVGCGGGVSKAGT
jgi:hypothetical protein